MTELTLIELGHLEPKVRRVAETYERVHLRQRPGIVSSWAQTEDGQEALAAEEASYLRRALAWARTKEGRSALAAAETGDAALLVWTVKRMAKSMRDVLTDVEKIAHVMSPAMKQEISEDIGLIQADVGKIVSICNRQERRGGA